MVTGTRPFARSRTSADVRTPPELTSPRSARRGQVQAACSVATRRPSRSRARYRESRGNRAGSRSRRSRGPHRRRAGSIPSSARPRSDIRAPISSAVPGTSTNSRIHDSRTFISTVGRPNCSEEAQVVFVEQANVIDVPLEDGDAFEAHAKREARHAVGVVADVLEHRRVHHAAAENLDPARALADGTSSALAADAADVHLGARLRIREEAGAEADVLTLAEERPGHREERALEIG